MNNENNNTMAMKAPRRARQIINRLLATKQVTPEGVNWLIAATDPFHDTPLEVRGYPDGNQCNTLVQIVQKTVNIPKPATVSDAWDAHIFFNPVTPSTVALNVGDPIIKGYARSTLTYDGQVTTTNGTYSYMYGGFNIHTVAAGQSWQDATTNKSSYSGVSIPPEYCAGQFRLIGAAVEVVNTTAALYQSGSCSAYRIPSTQTQAITRMSAISGADMLSTLVCLPPPTQDAAILMPTTKTWSATKGLYSVAVQSSVNNPLNIIAGRSSPIMVMPLGADKMGTNGTANNRVCWASQQTDLSSSPVIGVPYNSARALPFDISGAVFAGLHPETTLQVTVKYLFERVPCFGETDLVPLARPPPGYDPLILELYSRVMSEIPVGCTVDENPLGEWFWTILKGIEYVAPIVGAALSPFTGGVSEIIGAGVGGLAAAGGALRPRENDGRQRQQKRMKETVPTVREVKTVRKPVKKIAKAAAKKEVKKEMKNQLVVYTQTRRRKNRGS